MPLVAKLVIAVPLAFCHQVLLRAILPVVPVVFPVDLMSEGSPVILVASVSSLEFAVHTPRVLPPSEEIMLRIITAIASFTKSKTWFGPELRMICWLGRRNGT